MAISKIISAGQTGVDRAALDAALARSLSHGGWCPLGGLADDFMEPPGLIAYYPQLRQLDSPRKVQTIEWNTSDSDAALILFGSRGIGCSPMTVLAQERAQDACKPAAIADVGDYMSLNKIADWLASFNGEMTLHITGPKETEQPGIYQAARYFIDDAFNSAGEKRGK